jgi:hypothetical protein
MTPEEEQYLRNQGHVVGKDRPIRGALSCVGLVFGLVSLIRIGWELVTWDWQILVLVGVASVIGIASLTGDE